MTEKWVDITRTKWNLGFAGLVFLISAIAVAIWVPAAKSISLDKTVYTFAKQAQRAATPVEFTAAIHQYDQALERADMKVGNTSPFKRPHTDIAYFRGRLISFVDQANAMAQTGNASVESSTGLIQLKNSLFNAQVSFYGYWLLRQGGMMMALYLPLGLAVVGVVSIITGLVLPGRKVTIVSSGA